MLQDADAGTQHASGTSKLPKYGQAYAHKSTSATVSSSVHALQICHSEKQEHIRRYAQAVRTCTPSMRRESEVVTVGKKGTKSVDA